MGHDIQRLIHGGRRYVRPRTAEHAGDGVAAQAGDILRATRCRDDDRAT